MKSLHALVLAVLCAVTLPAIAQTKFQSLTTYALPGYTASRIALGDFNHDGSVDMAAIVNENANFVSIFLNNGDGTFKTSAVTYPAGGDPVAVAVGDFNGDGKLDLVVANSTPFDGSRKPGSNAPGSCTYSCVMVLLGNGDGTFQPGVGYTAGAGAIDVAVADVNGDGKLDIITSNSQASTVSILLGNGDGTFQPAVGYTVAASPWYLVVGDFNGDHRPDIAVANNSATGGGVQILLNNGNGTFGPAVSYLVGGVDSQAVAVADFNGDGKLDVAVGYANFTSGSGVGILLGNGDGTFQGASNIAMPYANVLSAADADGDGKPDLIVSANNGFTIALSNSDGSFQSPVSYGGFILSSTLVAGDLNGDGKLDIAATNFESVSVIFGFGDGTFPAPRVYNAVPNSDMFGLGVVAGDFNKDGFVDVAYRTGILLGNGDGTFTQGAAYSAGGANSGIAADFNNDGNLDLAWGNEIPNGTVYVQLGNGDGTFQKAMNNPAHKDPIQVVAADFNHDGVLDLATANWNSGDISVLLGKGNGTFSFPTNYRDIPYPVGIAAGDFNGDGNPDLVVSDGEASVLLGRGDGTFMPAVNYEDASAYSVAVADINSDGKLDIVTSGFGTLSVLLGKGDGTFQPEIESAGANPLHLLLGDFNGDGNLDAVTIPWYDLTSSGPITVQLGNGDGTFQPPVSYGAGFAPLNVTEGDFNGDGATDLAVSSYSGITILLNTGGTFLATTGSPNPSTLQQNVTFTTTVTAGVRGEPVPTGSVTFKDGTTTLGTATLSNGQATLKTAFTTAGQHLITPSYSGDSNFNPHTGAAFTQTVQAPKVNLSRNTLNFPTQKVGTTSAPLNVTLTNRGAGTLLISSINLNGPDFGLTNNCGSSLGQNKSCILSVTFTPTKTGKRTGTITISDNATNSPQLIKLAGTGD